MTTIEWIETSVLTPNRRNARTHSTKQIRQIATLGKQSLDRFRRNVALDQIPAHLRGVTGR